MRERYTPDDLTTAYAPTRVLKETFGSTVRLAGYRADYEMAFRQNPTHPDQAMLTLEATWDPEAQKVRVLEVYGQPFGGKGSQFHFIQGPTAMVHFAR
eukprot:6997445-Alexandrium_andersonii.AAC.1